MDTRTRWMLTAAAAAWLVIAGFGVAETRTDDNGWLPYTLYMLALIVGAALIVVAAASATQIGAQRRRLRIAGLVVSGVGILSTIVAGALPLWMALLGIGLTMLAAASGPRARRAVAVSAAGQALGIVALFAGIAAEIGETDEYGDYPAASGIALIVTAIVTIVALVDYAKGADSPVGERLSV
jgi:hypothetical protein